MFNLRVVVPSHNPIVTRCQCAGCSNINEYFCCLTVFQVCDLLPVLPAFVLHEALDVEHLLYRGSGGKPM